MSNVSRIVIVITVILSFLFIKEKTGFNFDGSSIFNPLPKISAPQENKDAETVKPPSEIIKKDEVKTETADIYFLALDSNDNGIYKKVKRTLPQNTEKMDFILKELLKGPNVIEKAQGAYSEIPQNTKLLGVKEIEDKIIINLSSDFELGGGTDSIYSRMMQLIKTSSANSGGKKVYLQLNGKQIKIIGGEGIMISQPLSENSLDI